MAVNVESSVDKAGEFYIHTNRACHMFVYNSVRDVDIQAV